MNNENLFSSLLSFHLLSGCKSELINEIIKQSEFLNFKENTVIDTEYDEPFMTFILKGKVVIYSEPNGSRIPMRFTESGDVLGIASVFLKDRISSEIRTLSDTSVLILSQSKLLFIFEKDTNGSFRNNMLTALSYKVQFLNTRFSTVSGGSCEQKLASFLLSSIQGKNENGINTGGSGKPLINLNITMKELAEILSIGRASLYRVIDKLSDENIILRTENGISILNKTKLMELTGTH